MDQEVVGPVARIKVATQRSPLTCDATQSPLPFLNRDPRMCQESRWPWPGGLYIGSMCNREDVFYFLLPPPRPLSGAGGEGIFETKHRHHK